MLVLYLVGAVTMFTTLIRFASTGGLPQVFNSCVANSMDTQECFTAKYQLSYLLMLRRCIETRTLACQVSLSLFRHAHQLHVA